MSRFHQGGKNMENAVLDEKQLDVRDALERKLVAFESAINRYGHLEIDGDIPGETPETHYIKVVNHQTKEADQISLAAIMAQEVDDIAEALATGVTVKVWGVTRIVGYYSRVTNWNKSKISELHDRHNGNYGISPKT
ncbi:MAG: hypothetical protein E3K37_01370 [Candidatus Kuenenia sp.]|nr:hypothetical protein [Candidatus Kuenenia hertensis]